MRRDGLCKQAKAVTATIIRLQFCSLNRYLRFPAPSEFKRNTGMRY
jgi:hypothetical protein